MDTMQLRLGVGATSCGAGFIDGCFRLSGVRSVCMRSLFAKLSLRRRSFHSNRLVLLGPLVAVQGIGGGLHARLLGVAEAFEVPADAVKKKERLSREERAAVVETYVRRYMASHQGQFPRLAAVLRETGGSRNIVRDILSELAGTMKLKDTSLNALEDGSETEEHVHDPSMQDSSLTEVAISALSNGESMAQRIISEPKYETSGDVHEDSKNVVFDVHDSDESIMKETGNDVLSGMSQYQERSASEKHSSADAYGHERMSLWDKLHASISTKANHGNGAYVSELRAASHVSDVATHSDGDAGTSHLWSSREMDDADYASLDYPEVAMSHYRASAMKLDSSSEEIEERGRVGHASSKHVLFVRYLHPDATSEDLKAAFQDCGHIIRARPIRPKRGLEGKYIYGFVDFDSAEGIQNALKKDVDIRGIRVEAQPSTSRLSLDLPSSVPDAAPIRRPTSAHGLRSSHLLKTPGDSILDEGYPVLLRDVPQEVLFQVQGALSAHGDIISSYSKVQDSGNVSVHVSFKTEVAKESALAAHWIHLGGKPYQILRLDNPKTTVVRISNIAAETSEEKVYNACKLCGYINCVKPRTVGVVDVYFHPNEIRHMIQILDRLNEVNIDKRRWRAQPAPICSPEHSSEICRSGDGRKWLQSQQFQVLGSLENSLKDALMHTEDLRVLLSLQGSNGNLASSSTKINSLTSMLRDVANS